MLTRAFNRQGEWVSAGLCPKGEDFICPECRHAVRTRAGTHIRAHFFHHHASGCRLTSVSPAHRYCQRYIQSSWHSKCLMEHWFASIGRIADLYMPTDSLVVEIQYSPIALSEVTSRTHDYRSLGLEVIWILNEASFISHPLLQSIAHLPHYFTTIDNEGKGQIVDICDDHIHPLHITKSRRYHSIWSAASCERAGEYAKSLWQRAHLWPLGLEADLVCSMQT